MRPLPISNQTSFSDDPDRGRDRSEDTHRRSRATLA